MPAPRPLRLAPEWDEAFTRSVGLSAVVHLLAVAVILIVTPLAARRPMPLTAYTVELTDPNALGGRIPPGAPGRTLAGGPISVPAAKGEPDGGAKVEPGPAPAEPVVEVKAEPPKAEPKPEPKPEPKAVPEEPTVTLPDKKVAEKPKPKAESKPPPPQPEKVESKPAAKPEAPKVAAKTEPRVDPKPAAKPETPPRSDVTRSAVAAPTKPTTTTGRTAGAAGAAGADDAYAKAADRWFKTQDGGGGLGGTDRGSGPIGSGGEGPGGGGQVVGLDFLAYQQRVVTTVKSQWVNVVQRPGLVATVRFNIAPDGTVSGAQLVRSSGNGGYDQSVLRAVQVSSPLPRPPARYVTEFSEFEINFESQEKGGQGVG